MPINRQTSSELIYDDPKHDPVKKENILLHKRLLSLIENELEFSVRAANCLKRKQIRLVGDLIQTRNDDLLKIKGLGKKTINEIHEELEDIRKKIDAMFPKSLAREDGRVRIMFSPWNESEHLDDEFLRIMRNQEGKAGFLLDGETTKLIGLQHDHLSDLAARLRVKDKTDKEKLLSTAIITRFLEKQFCGTTRYYLRAVLKPHREWMEFMERKFVPIIDGVPLEKWIVGRVFLQ